MVAVGPKKPQGTSIQDTVQDTVRSHVEIKEEVRHIEENSRVFSEAAEGRPSFL